MMSDDASGPRVSLKVRLVSLFVMAALVQLLYGHIPGSGAVTFSLLTLFLFGLTIWYLQPLLQVRKFQLLALSGSFILTLFLILTRLQPFALFVLFWASIFQLGLLALWSDKVVSFGRGLLEYILMPVALASMYVTAGLKTIRTLLGTQSWQVGKRKSELSDRFKPYVGGLLISVPVVLVLLTLLTGADPIFGTFIKKILPAFSFDELVGRVMLSLFVLVILAPLLLMKVRVLSGASIRTVAGNFAKQWTVVVISVVVVLTTFLIVQWPYVFANIDKATDLTKLGIATYSEYVRRGFSELVLVAGLVYGVVGVGLLTLHGHTTPAARRLKLIQTVLLILTVIFVISIFRRVYLYQLFHGLSLVRIYGSIILSWLLGMVGILALRHYFRMRFVRFEVALSVLTVLTISVWNIEDAIARISPPTVNGRVDYVYLANQSAEGYEGWKLAFAHAKKESAELFSRSFFDANARCRVLYTGAIATKLLKETHEYTGKYATEPALRQYLTTLLPAIEKSIQTNEQLITDVWYKNDKRRQREELLRLSDALQVGKQSARSVYDRIHIYPLWIGGAGEQGFDAPIHSNTYYIVLGGEQSPVRSDPWAYLYAGNLTEHRISQQITQDFPVSELVSIVESYHAASSRIHSQGDGQNTCTPDISTSTSR